MLRLCGGFPAPQAEAARLTRADEQEEIAHFVLAGLNADDFRGCAFGAAQVGEADHGWSAIDGRSRKKPMCLG